jgi:sec-independent protein translocase protein TatB
LPDAFVDAFLSSAPGAITGAVLVAVSGIMFACRRPAEMRAMFDIGWSEFLVIGVVALIVIGPKELPAVLRTVGQWTTKIRRMASEFQSQFQEAMREAEMADLKKEVDNLTDTAKDFTSGMSSHFDPLDTKEATKWEPKVEEKTGEKADETTEHTIEAPAATMPAEAPPPEAATPDGYSPPPATPHPAPVADAAPTHPATPVPEGSGSVHS